MKSALYLIVTLLALMGTEVKAQDNLAPSMDLIIRTLPKHHSSFITESIAAENGKDVFEIETKGNKIVLRGNNGISIASALYHYLNEYAHCQITWNGTNLKLPKILPAVPTKVRKVTPYEYRYYLNYCTINPSGFREAPEEIAQSFLSPAILHCNKVYPRLNIV